MLRALLVAISILSSTVAYSEPSGAEAEALFRQGRELMTAGRLAEACAVFEQSEKLEPATTTLLNLAGCREQNHQIATAWGLFLLAERQTRSATDDASSQLHVIALERATKLEPRVSKLTISVSEASHIDRLVIHRDNEPIDPATWNRALPIDGGTYKITASAPGASEWTTTVVVGVESDTKTVDVPELVSLAPAPAPRGDEPPEEPAAPPATADHGKRFRLAVGIASAALLGSALGFELWGDAIYDEAKQQRDAATQNALWHSANTKRYLAEGFAVAGLAGAGVFAWLFLRGGHRDAKTAMVPTASTHNVELVLVGRF